MARNAVRDGGRSEPGETERPDVAAQKAAASAAARRASASAARRASLASIATKPVIKPGYDPSLPTTIKTQADADRYTASLQSLNRNQKNQIKVAKSQLATINIRKNTAALKDTTIVANRSKYSEESLSQYQKEYDAYIAGTEANIAELNSYITNVDTSIKKNNKNINKLKEWASSPPTTTTRIVTPGRKVWKVTFTDPKTGKKTAETFLSRNEMNRYIELYQIGKDKPWTVKKKQEKAKESTVATYVPNLTRKEINQRIKDVERSLKFGLAPPPKGGKADIITSLPPTSYVTDQDKENFAAFAASVSATPQVTAITDAKAKVNEGVKQLKVISDNLKASGGFPTPEERAEVMDQVKANPWLAYDTEIFDDPPETATEAISRIGYLVTEGALGVIDELTFPFEQITRPTDELDVGVRLIASLITPTHWDIIAGKMFQELGDLAVPILKKIKKGISFTSGETKSMLNLWEGYLGETITPAMIRKWGIRKWKSGDAIDVISDSMNTLFGAVDDLDDAMKVADIVAVVPFSKADDFLDDFVSLADDQRKVIRQLGKDADAMNDFIYALNPEGITDETVRVWDTLTVKEKQKIADGLKNYIKEFYDDPTKLGGAGAALMPPEQISKFNNVMTEAGFSPQEVIAVLVTGVPSDTFISPNLLATTLLYLQSPLAQAEIDSLGISDVEKFKKNLGTALGQVEIALLENPLENIDISIDQLVVSPPMDIDTVIGELLTPPVLALDVDMDVTGDTITKLEQDTITLPKIEEEMTPILDDLSIQEQEQIQEEAIPTIQVLEDPLLADPDPVRRPRIAELGGGYELKIPKFPGPVPFEVKFQYHATGERIRVKARSFRDALARARPKRRQKKRKILVVDIDRL